MPFICPTFQRPERLAELAASWREHEPDTPLFVRIWEHDPFKEEYFSREWPESWKLYEGAGKGAGEALNEFYKMSPDEDFYGFIGDDVVLRTTGGIKMLAEAAGEWFLAFPNDCLQRFMMPTHFCIGGNTVRELQCVVPPMLKHNYIDQALMELMQPMHLIRWCPQVCFQHKHFLVKPYRLAKDETYRAVYPTDECDSPHGEYEQEGLAGLQLFRSVWLPKAGPKLMTRLLAYEKWYEWEDEDVALHCAV